MDWYFDHNVYHHLLDNGPSAPDLSRALRARGAQVIIGEHNSHEAISCWKRGKPETVERGQRLIRYAMELAPARLLLPTPRLIRFEIAPIIGNAVAGPFLDPESEALTRERLLRFAAGDLREEDLANLERLWRAKEEERNLHDHLRRNGLYDGRRPADDFEAFVAQNRELARAIAQHIVCRHLTEMGERERRKAAKMAAARLGKCPALRAAVRANLFLNHRLMQGKKTRHDVWDDLYHCISATYADVFVTGDGDLGDYFRQINPECKIIGLGEFRDRLGI